MSSEKNKLRVLLITRNLPPLLGGMERLIHEIARHLGRQTDLTIIGPRGCREHLPGNIEVLETPAKLAPFLICSTMLALRACWKTRFNIAIGGSGLIAPTLRILARVYKLETLVYLHGLDLVVNNATYQRIFVPSITRIDKIIVNSRNTERLAVDKGVAPQRVNLIHPGTFIPDRPSEAVLQQFRAHHGIRFRKIMIFVGRMTRRKGLSLFIERSLPQILRYQPDAGLLIVGNNPNDSLNQLGEEERVLSVISGHEFEEQILFLGRLSDSDLKNCYALADVQVFPVKEFDGDVEGFGMVAIEAAALGTPTVAFDTGGVGDAITRGNGKLVSPGRYDEFAGAIVQILQHPQSIPNNDSCIEHASNFSWEKFHEKFARVITPE